MGFRTCELLAPLILTLVCTTLGTGCDGGEEPDPCEAWDTPDVILGQGVGGEFAPFEDGEAVGLAVAPQGGFGVTVLVQTQGLEAGDLVQAILDVERGGAVEGSFTLDTPLVCQSDGSGARISGVVVGFDPQVYATNDDLLALDGQEVELIVTVTDGAGNTGVGRQVVVVQVGS